MNTPPDPRKHPLQDDEIALARVLRALPAGEPSPSVDAAILAAATDAVPRRRKVGAGPRWLPTWAMGTAAAAVLAVGVGIQLRPPLLPSSPKASTSDQFRELPPSRPRMAVELPEPEITPIPPPAPPPAPPPSQPQAAPRFTAPAAPAPQAPLATFEMAEPPAESAAREESAPVPFEDLGGFAPPPASAPAPQQQADRDSDVLDRVEVTGSRVRTTTPIRHLSERIDAAEAAAALARAEEREEYRYRRQAQAEAESTRQLQDKAEQAPLPELSQDATLPPREWLDRIRARDDRGDRAGARESLALFVRTYPQAPIPRDLAHLR